MGVINEILNINENTIYGKKTKEINPFLLLKTADTEDSINLGMLLLI